MTEQQESNDTKKTRQTTRTRRPSSSDGESTTKQRTQTKSAARSSDTSKREQTTTKRRTTPKISANKATVAALKQLQLLTTRTPESVVGLVAHEDGWRITIEVVESARIPNTADIMAEYEVDIDGSGELTGYTRQSRYFRGRTTQTD